MPAMIDSQGNPGTGGSVIGVETVLKLDDVLIVVGVLMTVLVTTEVLTTVLVNELLVVTSVEDVEVELLMLELLKVLDIVEAALVVVVGVDEIEVVANTPPGGSK